MNKLFTPYKLGPITLRNRFIRSAAFENMCTANMPSQMLEDYHVSVAHGGVGMTTVAYCAVDLSGVSFDGQLYVRDEALPGLKKLTDAVHAEGAKASIQLGHCGNMTHISTCHCMPVSASNGFNLYSPTIHRRLKVAEIKVLDEVMKHAGKDMAVVVKTNMWDDCWHGSDIEEGIKVAKEIAKHKVHGIVLSGGTVSRSPMTILRAAMPINTLAHYMPGKMWWLKAALHIPFVGAIMTPTQPFKELYFMEQAKRFQEAIKDVPLIYVGGVQSGDNCQTIMDEGFELFQLAHVLIKDPDFVNHVKENPHYHAGCGRSNYCVGRMYSKEMKCHECVERDGEKIPNCLKREITKLEKQAKEANERQKKC